MNRVILLIIGLLFSSMVMSQTSWFRITSVSFKSKDGLWSAPERVNILISVNSSIKRIEIFSAETQVIDYTGFESANSTGTSLWSLATDSNYKKIYLKLYVNSKGVTYLEIWYSDLEIKYELTSF